MSTYGFSQSDNVVLEQVGRTEQALTAANQALTVAPTDSARLTAARDSSRFMQKLGHPLRDCKSILERELNRPLSPSDVSRVWAGIAVLYKNATPPDIEHASIAYEIALQSDPVDTSLRFDLAHMYSEDGANELALFHYRAILEKKEADTASLNNAGVAAERIGLSISSVNYYLLAEHGGNSLASANLAYRLLRAGFKAEAIKTLEAARSQHGSAIHSNVLVAVGEVAGAEQKEEELLVALTKRASQLTKFRTRLMQAESATLADPAALTGEYGGPPALVLAVTDIGAAQGSFNSSYLTSATLTGTFEGRVLRFKWSTVDDTSYMFKKSGHGVLLVVDDDHLEGFWSEGEPSLDSAAAAKSREWVLRKSPKLTA